MWSNRFRGRTDAEMGWELSARQASDLTVRKTVRSDPTAFVQKRYLHLWRVISPATSPRRIRRRPTPPPSKCPPQDLQEPEHWFRISASARELAAASISANTRTAYQGQLQRLYDYLDGQPLTDDTLAEYLTSLHDTGKSPAGAGQLVAAVRFQSKVTGQPSPVGPASQAVLAGLRRQGKGRGRGQVKGIQWRDADVMAALAANGDHSLAGLRDAAIIATMSDAMLRVSELCALVVEDITFEPDGSGRLTIRSSKTDQEGKGAVQYLGRRTVKRIRAWLDKAGFSAGPLFRRVRRGDVPGNHPLTVSGLRLVLKRRAAADIEGRVSGHSLRVGSAQSLVAHGATIVEMQIDGRWSSPQMPGHYARAQLAGQGAVARLRYGA